MSSSDQPLMAWIRGLRERLDNGDLAGLNPIEIGPDTARMPAGITIRTMLADLADLDDPQGSGATDLAWREERRRVLQDDFARLKDLIG
jgi:hypothetical protein